MSGFATILADRVEGLHRPPAVARLFAQEAGSDLAFAGTLR